MQGNLDVTDVCLSYSPLLSREFTVVEIPVDKLYNQDVTCDNIRIVNLCIPYAGQSIRLQLYWEKDSLFPDILFDEVYKDFSFFISNEDLVNYNSECKTSLTKILKQLFKKFGKFHLSRIQNDYVLHDLNDLILNTMTLSDQEAQLEVLTDEHFNISILIGLDLNADHLPAYLAPKQLGGFHATLLFYFPSIHSESRRIIPELNLSENLMHVFDAFDVKIRCPKFNFSSGDVLTIYKEHMEDLIQQRINSISSSRDQRKAVFDELLSKFGTCVCEFDAADFMSISLLFEWRDFFFCAQVAFSSEYPHPDKPPEISLISVYHESRSRPGVQTLAQSVNQDTAPLKCVFTDMPYSPRWNSKEMTNRIEEYIFLKVPGFLDESVRCGSL